MDGNQDIKLVYFICKRIYQVFNLISYPLKRLFLLTVTMVTMAVVLITVMFSQTPVNAPAAGFYRKTVKHVYLIMIRFLSLALRTEWRLRSMNVSILTDETWSPLVLVRILTANLSLKMESFQSLLLSMVVEPQCRVENRRRNNQFLKKRIIFN